MKALAAMVIVPGMMFAGAARAGDVSFAVDVAPNAHVTGTVDVDDSSGDINSVTGNVSGAVSGPFRLDQVNTQADIGQGPRLTMRFDRRNQKIIARLCAADPCTGNPVTLWEKP